MMRVSQEAICRSQEEGMRKDGERSDDTIGAGLAVVVVLALLGIGGISLAQQIKSLAGAGVGDIIAFQAGGSAPRRLRSEVQAFVADIGDPAQPQASCLMNVRTMLETGGSMVVEAIDLTEPVSYRVHWAGGPTGSDNTACARKSDLIVRRDVLITLIAAASGFSTGGPAQPDYVLPDTALASGQ
jgi:hypothetical protein